LSTNSVDAAIVGCGVSGASAALALARKNVSVSIFEEHPKVGIPSHCSGHVGIIAFRRFSPQIPTRIIENKILGAILQSPNGKTLTLHRPSPVTWVLNRSEFDQHLASLAEKEGADLHLNSRVVGYNRLDDGRINLRVNDGHEDQVSCKILIDASGCGASISRYAGITELGRGIWVNSAQFSVDKPKDIDEDFVEVYFGQGFAPGFFGWIIPRRDGTAKVGIAAGARANVRECFERFIHKHPTVSAKLRHAKQISPPTFHPIPVGGGAKRTYTDNIMTVGDAASQVKPTTGGGIVFGLACGRIAGETAARAIRSEDLSAQRLKEYETRWREIIGFDLRAMSYLRRLLYRLPDRNLDRIFGIADELGADQILNRTADIDFQGKTLLALAHDPRLFTTLLSASILSVPSLVRS
jgi:geranylgeranyl reductase family protein